MRPFLIGRRCLKSRLSGQARWAQAARLVESAECYWSDGLPITALGPMCRLAAVPEKGEMVLFRVVSAMPDQRWGTAVPPGWRRSTAVNRLKHLCSRIAEDIPGWLFVPAVPGRGAAPRSLGSGAVSVTPALAEAPAALAAAPRWRRRPGWGRWGGAGSAGSWGCRR